MRIFKEHSRIVGRADLLNEKVKKQFKCDWIEFEGSLAAPVKWCKANEWYVLEKMERFLLTSYMTGGSNIRAQVLSIEPIRVLTTCATIVMFMIAAGIGLCAAGWGGLI